MRAAGSGLVVLSHLQEETFTILVNFSMSCSEEALGDCFALPKFEALNRRPSSKPSKQRTDGIDGRKESAGVAVVLALSPNSGHPKPLEPAGPHPPQPELYWEFLRDLSEW